MSFVQNSPNVQNYATEAIIINLFFNKKYFSSEFQFIVDWVTGLWQIIDCNIHKLFVLMWHCWTTKNIGVRIFLYNLIPLQF